MKKKRLPRPDLYDLRRWCHASNVARRDAWNGCQAVKPPKPRTVVECVQTHQQWDGIEQFRDAMRCSHALIKAALDDGVPIRGMNFRRAS